MVLKGNKEIRILDYLLRLSFIKTEIERDVEKYSEVLWVHEIPNEKGCYTRAWGKSEETDEDIWIEIRKSPEPKFPLPDPELKDWIDINELRDSKSNPKLKGQTTKQIRGTNLPEGAYVKTMVLEDNPSILEQWDKYFKYKWKPWAKEHSSWSIIQNVYSKLFSMHQEQLKLGEEYELILGIGLLTWKTKSNQHVRRHVLVADTSLSFESRLNRFIVRPSTNGVNLRIEQDMLDIEEQPARILESIKQNLVEVSEDIWNDANLEDILKEIVFSINSLGEYHKNLKSELTSFSEKPVVEFAPALILRKRSYKGLAEIIRRIKERILNREKLPIAFRDIAEVDKTSKQKDDNQYIKITKQTTDDDIYFPKPFNEEQKKIIEKIDYSNIVLVQGPPGTGKSHTIANLICHLLATGMRILVTAKTPRALKVLEDHLPEQIRPLCIYLLGSSIEEKQSLETSVNNILRKNDQWDENVNEQSVIAKKERLDQLRREKSEMKNKIREIRESETYNHTLVEGKYKGTAAQIGIRINKEDEKYSWFLDNVPFDKICSIKTSDMLNIINSLRCLTDEKKEELLLFLPSNLISIEKFKELIGREKEAIAHVNLTSINIDKRLFSLLQKYQESEIFSLKEIFSNLAKIIFRIKSSNFTWMKNTFTDIIIGKSSVWKELSKLTKISLSKISSYIDKIELCKIHISQDCCDLTTILSDVLVIKEHLLNKKRLYFGPFCSRKIMPCKYIVKKIKINNKICDNLQSVELLEKYLVTKIELDNLWMSWKYFCSKIEGTLSIQYIKFKEIVNLLDDALSSEGTIEKCNTILKNDLTALQIKYGSEECLQQYVLTFDHILAIKNKQQIEKHISNEMLSIIESIANKKFHPIINDIINAIKTRDVDLFIKANSVVDELSSTQKEMNRFQLSIDSIKEILPKTMEYIISNYKEQEWNDRLRCFEEAWNHRRVQSWLKNLSKDNDLPNLVIRLRQIEDTILVEIAQIASILAWSHCFKRMKEEHKRHMEAWQQSIRKVGKGTGKYAPKHRREAQRHLAECKDVVPAWVMPVHRIWDTIDPAPGMFDIIIIDEASQCGYETIPLFYVGKKIVIVGDDKQISPDAVGISREAVNSLMDELLFDYKFKSSFDIENSLFDQGKLRCGNSRITLREHFRCMPEIIRFSNNLCYSDMPLIPLKQFGQDRLKPLINVHVKNGYREGTQQNVLNRPEADAIVNQLTELCKDDKYKEKTIGVIVLQGNSQAHLIENKLSNIMNAEEIEKRRIICGHPYSFQGDERDIIFLSMVAAPNERIGSMTKASDERRFNVAVSRAKEQIWLFHSVTQNELGNDCLRKRLLDFFTEPVKDEFEERYFNLEIKNKETDRSIVRPPSPFDSWFEVDVFLEIINKDYYAIPQFKISGKSIDIVIIGGTSRLAVECDGDAFHGTDEYERDFNRQRILERCGWIFFRVRASLFYANKKKALNDLWLMLDERGIYPLKRNNVKKPESVNNVKIVDAKEENIKNNKLDYTECDISRKVEIMDTVVYIEQGKSQEEKRVQIITGQSNPDYGTVNINTPLAQALLGSKIGGKISVKLPMGLKVLEIIDIKKIHKI